ncbi:MULTISPECIES: NADH-quinone oxidoreductase subunit N [Desulfosediminicola]|uniref:NADH-quinone oxidoreductase subunit N n=1 Tax=Desulfosediminicola TaxID=2886823 RepID=UPI0010AD326E|nr:NADH-quinone oxidoreductase subunit N [Desulfosediminicola ganghwensis]
MLFLPELTLLGAGLVFFALSLGNHPCDTIRNVAITLFAIVLATTLATVNMTGGLFYDAFRVDLFSQTFKVLIVLATLIVVVFTDTMPGVSAKYKAEYYIFLSMSVLGLMMLVSSVELLAIFVALELSSFAVYIMVPMRSTEHGSKAQMEAGIKYLLFGVAATGFMLFGMSYLFGLTGSTRLDVIITQLSTMYTQPVVVIAVALVLSGFFYKLALFPFHFWVPDIYQGASNETTAFIAAVPKIAAVAMLTRFVILAGDTGQVMVNLLMVCAVASMFYGNLSALVQKDLKRMLGFSGIAHAGFVLVGLLTFKITGYTAALYYITGYVFMNLACFLVICSVSKDGTNLAIEDLSGLYKRAPLLALTLTIGLFSLAGIPPFVGFTGKFMLLVNALKEDYLLLVVLAAINTAIAIYYYLSVVRLAFCTDTEDRGQVQTSFLTNAASVLLIICIIVMGILPSQFLNLAQSSISVIM